MNKLLTLTTFFLSTSVLASSVTTSTMFPITYVKDYTNRVVESHHTYQITNETNAEQSIEFCHEIATCVEYSYYTKAIHQCEQFKLAPHQSKSGSTNMQMTINYDFSGWCHAVASTEIKGGTYHISSNDIQFQVGK